MNAQKIRVLHVDDDNSILAITKSILESEGTFKVETATSADEALTKIKNCVYDVVISDYEMPIKSGLDFLKVLKKSKNSTPFILFTGKGREEIIVEALNLGTDRYIDKHGDPEAVYTELSAAIRQLYEKSQAAHKLWESEERFKTIVTNMKDIILLTQVNGTALYISPSVKEVLGYEPSEIIGTRPWGKVYSEDAERMRKVADQLLTIIGFSGFSEYRLVGKQGQIRWVNHTYSQIIENGKIHQIVSVIKDITENKKAEDALKESGIKFSAAFHSSGAALCFSRVSDGLLIDANESFMDLFGYKYDEIIGKTVTSLGLYGNINDRENIVKKSLANKPIKNLELKGRRKDGIIVTNLFSTKLVNLKGEQYLLSTIIDISSLRKTQATLTLRQKELEAFMGLVPNAITVTDLTGKIIYVNELAGKGYGIPKDQLVGMNVSDFIIESEREYTINNLKTGTTGNNVVSQIFHGRRSNGEVFAVDGAAKAIRDEVGNAVGFMIITRDISEKLSKENRIL